MVSFLAFQFATFLFFLKVVCAIFYHFLWNRFNTDLNSIILGLASNPCHIFLFLLQSLLLVWPFASSISNAEQYQRSTGKSGFLAPISPWYQILTKQRVWDGKQQHFIRIGITLGIGNHIKLIIIANQKDDTLEQVDYEQQEVKGGFPNE